MLARRLKAGRKRRGNNGSPSYEKMMKTLLLQNQQIIIQQQNMMFMVMKQLQSQGTNYTNQGTDPNLSVGPLPSTSSVNQHKCGNASSQHLPTATVSDVNNDRPQTQSIQSHHNTQQNQSQRHNILESQVVQPHQIFTTAQPIAPTSTAVNSQYQLQQVVSHIQETLGHYPTPAASEQDPLCDKSEEDEIAALLAGDQLIHNNLLYNPQTDIGAITPYKNNHQQHQTPSYYSSGCESLTTPRLDQQRQPTTANINQNVVKNLADHFKSPTKPNINVQIVSGGSMKDSKAKIIQSMNISEFLRHVHPDSGDAHRTASQ